MSEGTVNYLVPIVSKSVDKPKRLGWKLDLNNNKVRLIAVTEEGDEHTILVVDNGKLDRLSLSSRLKQYGIITTSLGYITTFSEKP